VQGGVKFNRGLREFTRIVFASWWGHITSAIDNKIALKNEPTGLRLEYRVKAINKGGESFPTNTVCVVL